MPTASEPRHDMLAASEPCHDMPTAYEARHAMPTAYALRHVNSLRATPQHVVWLVPQATLLSLSAPDVTWKDWRLVDVGGHE